jgi:sortase A
MTTGVLILLFVAYELWGTGIFTARAQAELDDDFEAARREYQAQVTTTSAPPITGPTATTATTAPGATTSAPPTTVAGGSVDVALPTIGLGDPIGRLRIPKIGVDWTFVQGTSRDELKKGPGHYPSTPYPGQTGNAAIAGHRTTNGAPFFRIDELEPGDDIEVETFWGTFTYRVQCETIVRPNDTWVAGPPISNCTKDAFVDPATPQLTLSSCNPKYSARERYIIKAELVVERSDAPAVFDPEQLPTIDDDGTIPGDDEPILSGSFDPSATVDGFAGDPAARAPALRWGLLALGAGLLWWWFYRHWRHWLSWLIGALPFAAALFGAFVYLERALPAGI